VLSDFQNLPISTNGVDWNIVNKTNNYIRGQIASSIVEKTFAVGLPPIEIVETWSVFDTWGTNIIPWTNGLDTGIYTNIFETNILVTTTNAGRAFEYTKTDSSLATGHMYITHFYMSELDGAIDDLFTANKFVAVNIATNDITNWFSQSMTATSVHTVAGAFIVNTTNIFQRYATNVFLASKANMFTVLDVGIVRDPITNEWGYIAGGDAFFTRRPSTTNSYILSELHRPYGSNVFVEARGFGSSGVNGLYSEITNGIYYTHMNNPSIKILQNPASTNEYAITPLGFYSPILSYYTSASGIFTASWTAQFFGVNPPGTTIARGSEDGIFIDIQEFDKRYYDENNFPVLQYRLHGTNIFSSLTVSITGSVLVVSNQTTIAAGETIVIGSTNPISLSELWYDISNITVAASWDNPSDVINIQYKGNFALYGDRPYRLYALDINERWKILSHMIMTKENETFGNRQTNGWIRTAIASSTNFLAAESTQNVLWAASTYSAIDPAFYRIDAKQIYDHNAINKYGYDSERRLPDNPHTITGIDTNTSHTTELYMKMNVPFDGRRFEPESGPFTNTHYYDVFDFDSVVTNDSIASNKMSQVFESTNILQNYEFNIISISSNSANPVQSISWPGDPDGISRDYIFEDGGSVWILRWDFDWK